ncbi:unnamed protein product, partial [Meganyctiphanes norvegica]
MAMDRTQKLSGKVIGKHSLRTFNDIRLHLTIERLYLNRLSLAGPYGQPDCYCWSRGPAKDSVDNVSVIIVQGVQKYQYRLKTAYCSRIPKNTTLSTRPWKSPKCFPLTTAATLSESNNQATILIKTPLRALQQSQSIIHHPTLRVDIVPLHKFLGPLNGLPNFLKHFGTPMSYEGLAAKTVNRIGIKLMGPRVSVDAASLYPEIADIILNNGGNVINSYDLISRKLHQLARDGNSEVLGAALSRLGDQGRRRINHLDGDKLSPLHYAARYAHINTVKTLINYGAKVNIRGQDKLTPLHFAARYRKTIKSAGRHGEEEVTEKDEEEEEVEEKEEGEEGQLTVTSLTSISGAKPLGEDSIVRVLVESGAEVNAEDVYGQTPLHFAAMRGNEAAALDLLSYPQVNIEANDRQAMTPLSVAATFGYTDIARRLINSGAQLLAMDESAQIPLHRAAMEGNLEIVELLLQAAVRKGDENTVHRMVRAQDSDRQTPLHQAVENGHHKVASRLLRAGADVNAVQDTLATSLHAAAVVGDEELIKLLIQYGGRVDATDANQQTPLHHAAAHDQSQAVTVLLDNGSKIEKKDSDSFTPLLLAACNGHASVVETLLDRGANISAVEKDDKTCIYWCADQGNVKALKVLLKDHHSSAMIDQSDRFDNSPLHTAAEHGYVEISHLLLEAGSKIDNMNEDSETALHIAAENGRSKVVRELVNRNRFLVSDENEDSNTALHLASLEGHVEVIKILLEFGANVEARNTALWTPLDCAASKGHVGSCLLLLDYDSPLDPMDKNKTTPLLLAARDGHVQVTKLLLERGASLDACDAKGRNALELSISNGRRDVAMAIIKSSEWENALRNVRENSKGSRITPFRMLVRKFPSVAELVLDKCTASNGVDADDWNFEMYFNFKYIDDSYSMSHLADITSIGSSTSLLLDCPYDDDGKLLNEAQTYTTDERELKVNHPLSLMIKYKRLNLLAHPVSISLVKHKWMKYGRWVYYSSLLLYALFLTFLTGYILTARDWKQFPLNDTNLQKIRQTPGCKELDDQSDLTQKVLHDAGKWTIIVLAVIHVLKEILQFYQARKNYFGFENLMEWICYVSAVLVVIDFNDGCYVREGWQMQLAAASIFLGWMNLLLFIRKFPFVGIYVVMFTDIFNTFARFCVVFLLFIIAFALSFYTVLRDMPPFETPGKSILKTTIMMIGEFEFDSIFNNEDLDLPYPEVTTVVFVAFIILMSIIIMNLLVGLAVDDIKQVQDQAMLKRLAMQTQLVLDVETVIPDFFRRMYSISKKNVHPNKRHGLFSMLFGDIQIMKQFDLEEGNKMSEQEEMRRDIDYLKSTLDEVKEQNRRLQKYFIIINHIEKNKNK